MNKQVHGYYDEDDPRANEDGVVMLPGKNEMCHRCDGEGTHVNPAVDCWDPSDWDTNDEDFRENYFAGTYDIPCEECDGNKVVVVPDFDKWDAEDIKAYHAEQADIAADRQVQEMERRMGA